jgi:hypothetical protein
MQDEQRELRAQGQHLRRARAHGGDTDDDSEYDVYYPDEDEAHGRSRSVQGEGDYDNLLERLDANVDDSSHSAEPNFQEPVPSDASMLSGLKDVVQQAAAQTAHLCLLNEALVIIAETVPRLVVRVSSCHI